MVFIANTTYTFSLSVKLDLKFLADRLWDSEYNPKRFPSIIMKMRKPKSTALISRNGKVVLVGCTSEYDALYAARKVCKRVSLFVNNVKLEDLSIKNMVVGGEHAFDLSDYWNKAGPIIQHDSEIFAGITVKLSNGMSGTLFRTGKFFVTGGKSIEMLEAGTIELYTMFL